MPDIIGKRRMLRVCGTENTEKEEEERAKKENEEDREGKENGERRIMGGVTADL